ncbi:ChrR family anti-sigma-E factor [Roseateles sp. DC23W]|uniref:ChrR family anti-sigma-E factor n=1 Tax=Pelomonas dachongensis TaxID=3299029 RepID=A0ABW7EJM5_9BURK
MEPLEIRHHPPDELLLGYASGALPGGTRVVLATHLELCPDCQARVTALRALGGALLQDEAAAPLSDDALARALARIDELQAPATVALRKANPPPPLPAGAVWPRALRDASATRWRWLGPGMRWSRVTLPDAPEANVFLLRIGAGKYLPSHTHTGTELTQILYGRFHDGRALFGPGDFDLTDGDVHHQPVVQDGSECICVAAVDGKLAFDGLVARWLGGMVGM